MSASSFRLRAAFPLLLAFSATFASAATKWLKLETPDVVVISDARPKDLVEFAIDYGAYHAAFQQLFAAPVRILRPTVLLFDDRKALQHHLPRAAGGYQLISFSIPIDDAVLNALAVRGDRTQAVAQIYEFQTVFTLKRCGAFTPLWMSEGGGAVLAGMEVHDGKYEVGNPGAYSWPSDSLPWPRFFEMSPGSPEYLDEKTRAIFRRQAWALMHRVLLGGGSPAANFARLSKLASEKGQLAGVEAFLGVPVDRITSEIKTHLSNHVHQSFAFDGDVLRRKLVPAAAPEIEVHVQLSNLLFASGQPNEAELELAAAQYLEPGAIAVKEARARAALRRGEQFEAAEDYRAAIALGTTNPSAFLRSAEARLGLSTFSRMEPGGAGEVANTALDEIRRALELDPENPYAYALLGKALFLAPEMREEDIAEVNRRAALGVPGEAVRYARALLYLRQNKTAECAADLRAILDDSYADLITQDAAKRLLESITSKSE